MTANRDHGQGVNLTPGSDSALTVTATCPLCARENAPRIFCRRDRVRHHPGIFGIHRCGGCGAIFIQPWLRDEELTQANSAEQGRDWQARWLTKNRYQDWQRLVLEHHYGYPSKDGPKKRVLKKIPAFLLSFVTAQDALPYRGSGKILDVGCGAGSFLRRLKEWGWDTYGVESSETAAEQARALGLRVTHGSLTESPFESAFFDVVRLSHVLEHLKDPKAVFREIDRILRPDGLVYVTASNTRGLGFLLFQENWYALDSPRHVIFYCLDTLKALCDATGFEIAHIRYASGPFVFVRSMANYLHAQGKDWPQWIRNVDWPRNKWIGRAARPFLYGVDAVGFGDIFHATLQKKPSMIQRVVLSWPAEAAMQGKLPNEQTI